MRTSAAGGSVISRILRDSLVAFVATSGMVLPVAAQERPRVLVRPDKTKGHPVCASHVHLDECPEGPAISHLGSHHKGTFSGGIGVQYELL